jgi:hypothetical protein
MPRLAFLCACALVLGACSFNRSGAGGGGDGGGDPADAGPDASPVPDAPPGTHRLTVTVLGSGSLSSSPAGIDCGDGASECVADFDDGEVVTLTPTGGAPTWGDACNGAGATCVVTMTDDKAAKAQFPQRGDLVDGVAVGSSAADSIKALAVAPNGDIVIGGSYANDLQLDGSQPHRGGLDGFVARMTPTGTVVWVVTYGDSTEDEVLAVTIDPDGDVIIGGSTSGDGATIGACDPLAGSGTDLDVAIARLDGATGACSWAQRFGGSANDWATGVDTSGGEIAISGVFGGTVDFDNGNILVSTGGTDAFVLLADRTTGTIEDSARFGGFNADEARAVAYTAAGGVALVGTFSGNVNFGDGNVTAVGFDGFFLSLSSSLALSGKQIYSGTGTDTVDAVALGAGNTVAVTGRYGGTMTIGGTTLPTGSEANAFVAVTVNNTFTVIRGFASNSRDVSRAVALPGDGSVVITGSFGGTLDFGTGPVTPEGGLDLFVVKLSAAGEHQWSLTAGDSGDDVGRAIGVDADSVWVGGDISGSATIDGVTLPYEGGVTDGVLLQLVRDP